MIFIPKWETTKLYLLYTCSLVQWTLALECLKDVLKSFFISPSINTALLNLKLASAVYLNLIQDIWRLTCHYSIQNTIYMKQTFVRKGILKGFVISLK